MLNHWFFLTLFFMGLNWLSVWHSWHWANFVSKPAIIVAMLIWFFSVAGFSFPALWFGLGLVFALAGDTLLMMPKKFFLLGMAAFMATHVLYVVGFNQTLPPARLPVIALVMACLSVWIMVYATLRKAAAENASFQKIEVPLFIYNLLILIMVISALASNFRPEWPPEAAVLVSCGSLLFLFSDVLLAVDRFIITLPEARLWKRVTYQLGQLAVIAGALLTFSA